MVARIGPRVAVAFDPDDRAMRFHVLCCQLNLFTAAIVAVDGEPPLSARQRPSVDAPYPPFKLVV